MADEARICSVSRDSIELSEILDLDSIPGPRGCVKMELTGPGRTDCVRSGPEVKHIEGRGVMAWKYKYCTVWGYGNQRPMRVWPCCRAASTLRPRHTKGPKTLCHVER